MGNDMDRNSTRKKNMSVGVDMSESPLPEVLEEH